MTNYKYGSYSRIKNIRSWIRQIIKKKYIEKDYDDDNDDVELACTKRAPGIWCLRRSIVGKISRDGPLHRRPDLLSNFWDLSVVPYGVIKFK